MLTRCVPLVFTHLALAIRVDDAHPLQKLGKIWVLLVLLEYLMKLLFVDALQAVLPREAKPRISQRTSNAECDDRRTRQNCPSEPHTPERRRRRPGGRTSTDGQTWGGCLGPQIGFCTRCSPTIVPPRWARASLAGPCAPPKPTALVPRFVNPQRVHRQYTHMSCFASGTVPMKTPPGRSHVATLWSMMRALTSLSNA